MDLAAVADFVAVDFVAADFAVVADAGFFATGFFGAVVAGFAAGVAVLVVESCAKAAVTASPKIAIPTIASLGASFDMSSAPGECLSFNVED